MDIVFLDFIKLVYVNLIIILVFIVLMKEYFSKDKISFYLMILISWSSYALVLNSAILILN